MAKCNFNTNYIIKNEKIAKNKDTYGTSSMRGKIRVWK